MVRRPFLRYEYTDKLQGVSISLKNFNQIDIAKDHSTVDVGPGNKWQAVYEAVEQQGLVVLGGRDGDIGVGGLTTGGGISLFSTEYGWVCDNVVSYQVRQNTESLCLLILPGCYCVGPSG